MKKSIKKPPLAGRWGEEHVVEILMDIEKDALETDILFLGRALTRRGLYPQLWSYWKQIFRHNEDIMSRIMRITCIFEGKIYEGALRKELSTWMSISALKRNYNWNKEPEPDEMEETGSPRFIHMDYDTVKVMDSPEFSGIYVKVKSEDKKALPNPEYFHPENPLPEGEPNNSYTS